MANRAFLSVVALLVALVILSMATFSVRETELAMKLRFGEIVRADYKPGLHFKMPFYHEVRKFERRVTTRNYPSEQFLTSEGKILRIDFYIKWRIVDISKYYTGTGGIEDTVALRLGSTVKDGIKGVIARRTIQQVVAAERTEFTGEILKTAESKTNELGVQLVDVRVKKIDLPEEVSDSVFLRMRQDFDRQAKQLRAEGDENAEKLKAEADRQRTELLSQAYREAQIIRGEGDARSAEVYARAYSRNAEFYSFYRSLQAYKNSLGKEGDVMVVSPDSDFFRYFKSPAPTRR
jgi:modulator of FtsH protease HflC